MLITVYNNYVPPNQLMTLRIKLLSTQLFW